MRPLIFFLTALLLAQCGQPQHNAERPAPGQAQAAAAKPVPPTGRAPFADTSGSVSALPDSIPVLRAQFLDVEADAAARRAACRSLIASELGQHVFLAESYPLRDNHVLIRGVLQEMARQGDVRAIPLAVELFRRLGGEERIDFEAILLQFGEPAVEPLLALLDAEDWRLVNRTMDALGKLKSTRAVEPLIAKLGDKESWIRIKAAHSLGDIGDARAVPPLMALLASSDYNVVGAALIGLGKLRAREAFDACLELTRHTNPAVRKMAASTLGKIGDPRAVPRLTDLLRDEDKGVAALARKALGELEAGE